MTLHESHLFVYGTLRCDYHGMMSRLLAKYAEFKGHATFQGKLYNIGAYPGAVFSNKSLDQVRGDLYRLSQPALVLSQLDQYEECSSGFPPPTEYIRKIQPVLTANGATVSAWIYLYNRPVASFKRISSGDYLTYANGKLVKALRKAQGSKKTIRR